MKTSVAILSASAIIFAGLEVASAAPNIYIPLGDTGQVQVIDSASRRVVATVDGVSNAHGLAITPDGRTLVVGSFSEAAGGAEATPPRPAGVSAAEHEKHHAKPSAQAKKAVGTSFVSIIDTATREVVRRVAVRGAVHHVAVSHNGKFAVTTHPGNGGISVISLEDFATIAEVPTGLMPNYAVFSADGAKLYVSNAGDNNISEIDVANWSVTRRLAAGGAPEHVVLSSDGATLYTNNVADGTASAISLADGRTTHTFAVGAAPHGIDLGDDDTTLFAISNGENKLVAFDLPGGKKREVSIGPAPYHLMALRSDGSLYVSSRAENRLWIVDQKSLAIVGELAIGGIGHQMAVAVQ